MAAPLQAAQLFSFNIYHLKVKWLVYLVYHALHSIYCGFPEIFTGSWSDLSCVEWDVKPCLLTTHPYVVT